MQVRQHSVIGWKGTGERSPRAFDVLHCHESVTCGILRFLPGGRAQITSRDAWDLPLRTNLVASGEEVDWSSLSFRQSSVHAQFCPATQLTRPADDEQFHAPPSYEMATGSEGLEPAA